MQKFITWLIENVFLYVGDILLGTEVIKQLKIQRLYSKFSADELARLQTKKLLYLLEYATSHCEGYYKYKQKHHNEPTKWLSQFPIISKRDILNSELYISNLVDKEKLIKYESSGSTGVRSIVYIDKKEESIIRAILIAWWEWNGYYFGKPILQTGMSSNRGIIKRLKDIVLSTRYMNAFGLSEYEVFKTLSTEKRSGVHLFGYASSLYEIAKIAKKRNLNLSIDIVLSQGDKLFSHYKTEIQETFNCSIVEDYGLNEGFMVGQKKDLPYFYIYTPNVFVEILNECNKAVKDGEMGRIVLTKLDGFAMPLIRYDTGDLGIMLPRDKYPKHRDLSFPLLERVVGRNTDIIKTPDGKTLIVHTFTGIFEFYDEIDQFQVIQDHLNSIIIKFIPSKKYTPIILDVIEKDFRKKTGSSIIINWEHVQAIAPSKSGKPQIVINNLIRNSLADSNE